MEGIKCGYRLKVLTDDQVDAIHEASLKILEKTGVRFDSEKAHARLSRPARVKHPTRANVLHLPQEHGRRRASRRSLALREVRARGTRRTTWSFDGETHVRPLASAGNPLMGDMDTGEHRMSTLKDVQDAHQDSWTPSPFCHSISNFVVATDVPHRAPGREDHGGHDEEHDASASPGTRSPRRRSTSSRRCGPASRAASRSSGRGRCSRSTARPAAR